MPPIVIAGAITAAGAIAGGAIAANAAGKAADTQVKSANYSAYLQKQAADDALKFNRETWTTAQNNLAPWLATGKAALGQLSYGLGLGTLTPGPAPSGGAPTGGSTTDMVQVGVNQAGDPIYAPLVSGKDDPYQLQRAGLTQQIANLEKQVAAGGPFADAQKSFLEQAKAQLASLPAAPSGVQPVAGKTGTYEEAGTGVQSYSVTPPEGSESMMGFGELMKPFDPSTVTLDPGFDFRIKQGQKALERSAAARGGLLSGGTAKALERYAQGFSSEEFGKAYERTFNTFETDQANRYNKLASVAGVGQVAANQLNATGSDAAARGGNIVLSTAQNIGDLTTQAANARASGYVGGANAWTSALTGAGNNFLTAYLAAQKNQPPPPSSFYIPSGLPDEIMDINSDIGYRG